MYPPLFWGKWFWSCLHSVAWYVDIAKELNPSILDAFRHWALLFSNWVPCANCSGHYRLECQHKPPSSYASAFEWSVDLHNHVNRRLKKSAPDGDITYWTAQYETTLSRNLEAVQSNAIHQTATMLEMYAFIHPSIATEKFEPTYVAWTSMFPTMAQQWIQDIVDHPYPPPTSTSKQAWFEWCNDLHRRLSPDTYVPPEQRIREYKVLQEEAAANTPKMTEAEKQQLDALKQKIQRAVAYSQQTNQPITIKTRSDNTPTSAQDAIDQHTTVAQQQTQLYMKDVTMDEITSWELANVLMVMLVALSFLLLYFYMSYNNKDIELNRLRPKQPRPEQAPALSTPHDLEPKP